MTRRGLRIGVVGVGRIGVFHTETLLGVEGVDSVVVADADASHAEAVGRELGVAAAASPEELVAESVDALVIAAATPAHAELIRLAASAGMPAFCEKPVALELDALDELIDDVQQAGTLVQIGFQRRFDVGYRAARDAVATGALGRVLVARAATHDPSPPSERYISTSGGIFRDLHIHDFDAIRFVTGREIAEVYADGAVRETEWFQRQGDVDTAVAILRLDDGALAVLTGTRHDPLGYDVRLEVFGTKDSIAVGLDPRSPLRSVEPDSQALTATAYSNFVERFEEAYRAELAHFVACVRDGGASACVLAEARAALAAAVAADRSRTERRPVAIEEVASAQPVTR